LRALLPLARPLVGGDLVGTLLKLPPLARCAFFLALGLLRENGTGQDGGAGGLGQAGEEAREQLPARGIVHDGAPSFAVKRRDEVVSVVERGIGRDNARSGA